MSGAPAGRNGWAVQAWRQRWSYGRQYTGSAGKITNCQIGVAQLHPPHRHRPDPALHPRLGSMSMPHQPLAPIRQPQTTHLGQKGLGFRLHRLGQQAARAAAQHRRQRIVHLVGLTEGNNSGIARHGASLLREVLAGSSPASIRRLTQAVVTQIPA